MTPALIEQKDGRYHWASLHEFIQSVATYYGFTILDPSDAFSQYPYHEVAHKDGARAHIRELGHSIVAEHLFNLVRQHQ